MNLFRTLAFALPVAMASAIATPVFAADTRAGDIVLSHAWSRATPSGAKVAGGYLRIENKGTQPDKLIGGSVDVATTVEVHEMAVNNGVMTMRPLTDGLAIAPGQSVELKPGGYHLMLMGLKGPVNKGDKLTVTLEFQKAGKVAVPFDVEAVGAKAHGHGGGDHKH